MAAARERPTLITVTDGRQMLAKGSFSGLKRGIVGLAGLKLKHLTDFLTTIDSPSRSQ